MGRSNPTHRRAGEESQGTLERVHSARPRGPSWRILNGLKHRCHALMDQVDGLEWANHDLELRDLSRRIPLDQIDPVYDDPVDFGLEFQQRIRVANNLA